MIDPLVAWLVSVTMIITTSGVLGYDILERRHIHLRKSERDKCPFRNGGSE